MEARFTKTGERRYRVSVEGSDVVTSLVITGCESMEDLEQALTAARTFKPMTDEQVKSLLSKTAQSATRGEYELFKTTSIYDGTASHPEWLGEEPPTVQRVIQTG